MRLGGLAAQSMLIHADKDFFTMHIDTDDECFHLIAQCETIEG